MNNNWQVVENLDQIKEIVKSENDKIDLFYKLGTSKYEVHHALLKEMVLSGYISQDDIKNRIKNGTGLCDNLRNFVNCYIVFSRWLEIYTETKNNGGRTQYKKELLEIIDKVRDEELLDHIMEKVTGRYFIRNIGDEANCFDKYPESIKKYFEIRDDIVGVPQIFVKGEKVTDWKKAYDPWQALKLAPKGAGWEVFEFYLENNPKDAKMMTANLNEFSVAKVSKRYTGEKLAQLSEKARKSLKEIVSGYEQLKENKRLQVEEINAYNELFKKYLKEHPYENEYGELKQFFVFKNGLRLQTEEDILLLTNEYLNSNLTMATFCKRYMIPDVDGFKEMLDAVSYMHKDIGKQIKQKSTDTQREFLSGSEKLIKDMIDPYANIGELIDRNKSGARSFKKLIDLSDKYFTDEVKLQLISVVYKYFARKLNKDHYEKGENVKNNLLTERELLFLIGSENYDKLKKGVHLNFYEILRNIVVPYKRDLEVSPYKIANNEFASVNKALTKYSLRFRRKDYEKSKVEMSDINGKMVKTTPEILDMAQHYMKKHGLYSSVHAIERVIKAIINNDLHVEKETDEAKQMLRKNILNQILECTNLQEYLKMIREYQINK